MCQLLRCYLLLAAWFILQVYNNSNKKNTGSGKLLLIFMLLWNKIEVQTMAIVNNLKILHVSGWFCFIYIPLRKNAT